MPVAHSDSDSATSISRSRSSLSPALGGFGVTTAETIGGRSTLLLLRLLGAWRLGTGDPRSVRSGLRPRHHDEPLGRGRAHAELARRDRLHALQLLQRSALQAQLAVLLDQLLLLAVQALRLHAGLPHLQV